MIYITINEENENKRLDIALSALSQFSRSMIQKLIYDQKIRCNDNLINKANVVTQLNQVYEITEPTTNLEYIVPEEGVLEILFEDEHIIVLNKNADLIVHPGAGNPNGTLINKLAYHCKLSDINGLERLGVVHRLDKGVSGCIIFAKTNQAHINISEQFQNRTIEKQYIALCYGKHNVPRGTMEDLMGRCAHERKKMTVNTTGKQAIMDYIIENCIYIDKNFGFISKIHCFPKTGRMHQIRVQLASRKMPIIGDTTYGKKQHKEILAILGNRIALHAVSIKFIHPVTNETMLIEAPIPAEFENIIKYLASKN